MHKLVQRTAKARCRRVFTRWYTQSQTSSAFDKLPSRPKPLSLNERYKEAIKSRSEAKEDALLDELEEEYKKFQALPILNENTKEVLEELQKSLGPEATKNLEERLKLFETKTPHEIIASTEPYAPLPDDYGKRATDVIMQHYESYYKTVSSIDPKDRWRTEFYELPPRVQEGLKQYKQDIFQLIRKFPEKYPQGHKAVMSRLVSAWEMASPKYFSDIPTQPIRVAITGAGGQIGYALAFRVASGGLFGPTVPVIVHLLELPHAMNSLKKLVMELEDSAFRCLSGIVTTDSPEVAFAGVDWALLVGASPRTPGKERSDLLLKNAEIFATQGKALDKVAKRADTRVVVVGNPANTNALIAQQNAPSIPAENFSAMTRLDHNRGLYQLAAKLGVHVSDIQQFVVWGNHSSTQFPDISYATVAVSSANGSPIPNNRPGILPDGMGYRLVSDLIEPDWVAKTFIPTVQSRGQAILQARGVSSAQSAASALVDAVHDWQYGSNLNWTSAAVASKGEYGVTKGLFFSYPVIYNNLKQWDIVKHLPIDEVSANFLEATHKELLQERDAVTKYLPSTVGTGFGVGQELNI